MRFSLYRVCAEWGSLIVKIKIIIIVMIIIKITTHPNPIFFSHTVFSLPTTLLIRWQSSQNVPINQRCTATPNLCNHVETQKRRERTKVVTETLLFWLGTSSRRVRIHGKGSLSPLIPYGHLRVFLVQLKVWHTQCTYSEERGGLWVVPIDRSYLRLPFRNIFNFL